MVERDIVAFLVASMATFGLIIAVIGILQIIGQWKAFKKAGKGGWEAIIPIYNVIVQCKIVGLNPLWVAVVYGGGIILNLIPIIGQFLASFLSIYFAVVLSISTARSFGKDDGFGVGILLLGPIFWPILGFSNAKYVGANPMNDPVWDFFEKTFGGKTTTNTTSSTVSTTTTTEAKKFCRECGAQITGDAKFCTSCGKEVK